MNKNHYGYIKFVIYMVITFTSVFVWELKFNSRNIPSKLALFNEGNYINNCSTTLSDCFKKEIPSMFDGATLFATYNIITTLQSNYIKIDPNDLEDKRIYLLSVDITFDYLNSYILKTDSLSFSQIILMPIIKQMIHQKSSSIINQISQIKDTQLQILITKIREKHAK